jgi:hypothetical protein
VPPPGKIGPLSQNVLGRPSHSEIGAGHVIGRVDLIVVHILRCVWAQCFNMPTLAAIAPYQAICISLLSMSKFLTVETSYRIFNIQAHSGYFGACIMLQDGKMRVRFPMR